MILFFLPSVVIAAENEVSIAHLDYRAGLSNSSVSGIVQDSYGFLWFGTQGGLNRYDGYRFQVYENEPYEKNSLSHNLIQTLYLDKGDILWIGTYGGLNRLDLHSGQFTFFRFDPDREDSLSNDVVVSIFRDSRGNLWVGTLEGLNLFREDSGTFKRFKHDPKVEGSLPHNLIRSILEDPRGNLWVGTSGGGLALYDYSTSGFTVFRNDPADGESLISDYVMSLAIDNEGYLWAGTWFGGISRYDHKKKRFQNYPTEDNRVYTINSQEKGKILVGTWGGGLFEFDITKREFTRRLQSDASGGLSNNIVYSIYMDRAGDLWLGTNGGGINHVTLGEKSYSTLVHNPKNPETLGPGKVNALLEDSRGDLWVGLYNGGLNRIDSETGKITHYRNDPDKPGTLSNDIVTSLYEDRNGDLWITTNMGINLYNREWDNFSVILSDPDDPASLSDNIVYKLLEDPLGNFWIATYTQGLDYYDRQRDEFIHYPTSLEDPESLSDNLVFSLAYDREGNLWVGTNNGLNRYSSGKFNRYYNDQDDHTSLSSNSIRVLYTDSLGELWIGTTSGGVCRYVPEKDNFVHYTKKEGLPNNSLVGILEDGQSNLWFITKGGIVVLDRKTDVIRKITMDSIFYNTEFQLGHYKTRSGSFFIGGSNILFKLNPEEIEYNTHVPPVVLTSLRVFNEEKILDKPIYQTDFISFSYKENYFSFTFSALDYRDPSKNQYAYMLEGFDRDWIYCGTRNYASYTNLPAGRYTFRVKGSNNDNIWNEEGTSLDIKVAGSPWASPLAYILYALGLVLLVFLVSTKESRRELRSKVEELLRIKAQLEEANKQLEDLTVIDPLTGIGNRRKLTEELNRQFLLSLREKKSLALIMGDLDYFKKYNDHYGHQKGDECLTKVAGAIRGCLERKTDFIARYGGEEFLIILPNTEREGALIVAEKIKEAVEALKIPHILSDASSFVTISLGLSVCIPETQDSPESLINRADDALYRAKLSGRNRISE